MAKVPVIPKDCDELGRISAQFLGRKTDGQNQQMRWSKRGAHLMLQVKE